MAFILTFDQSGRGRRRRSVLTRSSCNVSRALWGSSSRNANWSKPQQKLRKYLRDARHVFFMTTLNDSMLSGSKGQKGIVWLRRLMIIVKRSGFYIVQFDVRRSQIFREVLTVCTPGLHGGHRICKARPTQEGSEHCGLLKVSYYANWEMFHDKFYLPTNGRKQLEFSAWNFSINNVNESLNIKHGAVVTRLWTVELLDIN